ncbi:MAG TPA: apolipoprotein N-acyltransferase [Casimicrobiaceae bacterium]|jgi:apolipoprotein N-acyltransferase|nr:apolipoprotein N-acyltransferase [Casimicrobiaceae bacterium]
MRFAPSLSTCLAFVAGVATVFGFAPFRAPVVPVATLALLLLLWQDAARAGAAARLGFAFGLGLFGAGVSWVYVAIHTFGGMPAPLAAIGTAGFVGYVALFPAAAGGLAVRWTAPRTWARALAGAAAWTAMEWVRSWLLSGFGWLSLGYSQLPGSPFAGYAPIGGVFAVTLAIALAAAALALAIDAVAAAATPRAVALAAAVVALGAGGALLGRLEWTSPAGDPVAVSLVQGNVEQDVKFDPGFRERTYDLYTGLAAAARGRLIVLPESAFPVFAGEVPEAVLLALLRTAADRGGDVLVGFFTLEPPLPGTDEPRYYNSVATLGASPTQLYRKRHLVPFGETIPLDGVLGPLIRSMLAIPIASQSAGDPGQPPLAVAGQKVAVDICYEDTFGADIRPQAAAATLLVNVTNDAWYGRSLAAEQHAQIAQMRALETGRPMLRATNTGITSAIAHDGREIARLPWFTRGILEVEVTGRQGSTPYVRFGDAPAAALAAAILALAVALARRRTRAAP